MRGGVDDGLTLMRDSLEQMKRFDMPDFRPRPEWVREMKRFGILTAGFDPAAHIDVYATERKYWESLWYRAP